MEHPINSVSFRIENFEGEFALLKNEYFEIRWPIRSLPANLKIGETITLKMATQKSEENEKYSQMRRLLEELIN